MFLLLVAFFGCQLAMAQRCILVPNSPVALPAGGSYGFSAVGCGTGVTWSVTGEGTITQSGVYYAPTSEHVHNQDRGCQVSPNNSVFNAPVDTLPVDPHSQRWLARAAEDGEQYQVPYHNLKFYPEIITFFQNVVNSNSQQQLMHFYYPVASNGYQDTYFPMPPQRTAVMESGANMDPGGGYDRHLFTTSSGDCTTTEIYNQYVDFSAVTFTPGSPTRVTWNTNTVWNMPQLYQVVITGATGQWNNANGTWRMTLTGNNSGTLPFDSSQWGPPPSGTVMSSLPNGCPNCNSQGGQKFSPGSYAQLGGVDAAGMPIGALSVKMEEWYAATRAGRSDLGHAIRTTMSNNYLSSRAIWPAGLYALWVAGTRTQITAAGNGNPTILTSATDLSTSHPCDNYTFTAGCQFNVNIFGVASGSWMAINGDWQATAIDNTHYSIPLDSSQFGTFPGASFVFDFFPYGASLRLKSSLDLNQLCTSTDLNDWCPYAKVYLNTIKKYGLVVADGTVPADNWDSSVIASEFHPNVLIDAATAIRGWSGMQPIENYLEVVDRSSQQVYSDLGRYQASNVNRTTISACGSSGCSSTDILLQGTTIGTDHERLMMAAGAQYQLNVWTHGNTSNSLSYAIDQGIPGASVSSSGMLTMPNCLSKQKGMVTVTSSSDSDALPLYIEVGCLPVSADGGYRLALGNYSGDYVDSNRNTWWGSWANYPFDDFYEAPGLWWGGQTGSWQGFGPCSNDAWGGTDSQLYSRSTSFFGDTKVELILPNGNYNVTLYGEPGFGGLGPNNTCGNTANHNVYDWVVQGQTMGSWLDGYVLAGNQPYNGYTLTAQTTVSDNTFDTIGRMRLPSVYGMSWSSLLVAPVTVSQLTITTSSLPHAFGKIPYVAHLSASNGQPPYSWSLASGSGPLPAGLTLGTSGTILGTPTAFGSFPITVQVTDSQTNTATKNLNLTVCTPGHLC
ncbi:MAG TPA: Ig domain-containing protein [Chloroflexota bacterium]|nr:Ig domain-containing protein [Chloroflexota bacterium]